MKWLKGSCVARSFNPEGVFSVQNNLQMEGISSIDTIPMGGNLVLLQLKEEGTIEQYLGEDTICLPNWFHELKPWNPEVVAKEISVWINIIGVPIHGWKEDLFRTVVSMVGKYVNMDESTRKRTRLDVGRVYAKITSPEPINRTVQVMINNKIFAIWLLEDVFRFPCFKSNTDCVLLVVEETSSDDSDLEVDSNLAFSDAANDFGETDG